MKDTFTRREVTDIIISMFVFIEQADGKIDEIAGDNYGEMAERIISVNEANPKEYRVGKSVLSITNQFKAS